MHGFRRARGRCGYSDGPGAVAVHWDVLPTLSEIYYMVVPVTASGGRGASTFSVGVWSRTFPGHETFGLPLLPDTVRPVSNYIDAIPGALGILYFEGGAWVPHFAAMPAGVYDIAVAPGRGFQITTAVTGSRAVFTGR